MSRELIGMLFGLGMAVNQSMSYIFSRLFVIRRHQAAIRLLIGAHLWMAGFSLVVLPFVWSDRLPPFAQYALPLVCANLAYLAGQASLFVIIRQAQASRIVPLLALKIVVLAVLTAVFLDRFISGWQWVAVGLCVGAAFLLSTSGTALPLRVLPWLLCTLLGYSISDINIENLVFSLAPLGTLHASIVGTCFSYIFCGIVVLPLIPWAGGKRVLGDWPYALPFAFFWYVGIACLFACFAYVGPVFGNILQSTRGILSILIGVALARHGFSELEERVPGRALCFRLLAACLMVGAIWLFACG